MTYRKVSEVVDILGDRARAEVLIKKVSKGANKKDLDYIPWNETAGLLNDIFGPFGWDDRKVGSESDMQRGIYIVDLELTVKAIDDETGVLVEKRLSGRGMGAVPASQIENADAHDTAGKGAASDALSRAAKKLGEAFGIFLYDRGDPARGGSSNGASTTTQGAAATQETRTAAPSGAQPDKASWYGGTGKDGKPRVGYASSGQAGVLRTNGWTDEQIAGLTTHAEFKEVVDSQFGDGAHIKPTDERFEGRFGPPKIVQGGGRLQLVQPKTGTTDDEF